MKRQLIILGAFLIAGYKQSAGTTPSVSNASYSRQKFSETISVKVKVPKTKTYKTKSGKIIRISDKSQHGSASIRTIKIIPQGFKYKDPILIPDSDPIQKVLLADLDQDGFDELYIITQTTGSGSFGTLIALASDKDRKLIAISIPKILENDKVMKGYRGHDQYKIADGKLIRSFPIYNEDDPNCCPIGGTRELAYILTRGLNGWELILQ